MEKYFKKEFYKESIRSEIFRATVQAAVLAIIALIVFLISFFSKDKYADQLLNKDIILDITYIVLFFIALRSFGLSRILLKLTKKNKEIPEFVRYINIFIDISIPTIVIFLYSFKLEGPYPLLTPIAILYTVFILLSILELNENISFFAGIVAGLQYLFVAIWITNKSESEIFGPVISLPFIYIGKSVLFIISGVIAGLIAKQIKRRIITSLQLQDERNKLERIFGQQVSKKIVDEIVSKKFEIKSVRLPVTIMFLDIRGFTRFCDGKTPEEIVGFQNQIFPFIIEIITARNGIVNQILGDGMMATFGAPISHEDDAQNAFEAGVEIMKELRRRNEQKIIPLTNIGIGLHSGEAVAGNIGNEDRMQYSITGNVVIVASRIEQLNKEFKSNLLISKDTRDLISAKEIAIESLGPVTLKGRNEPIEIFRARV